MPPGRQTEGHAIIFPKHELDLGVNASIRNTEIPSHAGPPEAVPSVDLILWPNSDLRARLNSTPAGLPSDGWPQGNKRVVCDRAATRVSNKCYSNQRRCRPSFSQHSKEHG